MCAISAGASCIEAYAGSGWLVDPVSSWCTTNSSSASNAPVAGPNGTTNGTTNATTGPTTCEPSVGYIGFNMTSSGTLSGVLSAPGAFGVWLVPVSMSCPTIYYTIANLPVSCPPPWGPIPSYAWNSSISGPGSIDLAGPNTGPGIVPPASWFIIIADTGTSPEWVTATASVTLAPI
jgi:hypothetical protein